MQTNVILFGNEGDRTYIFNEALPKVLEIFSLSLHQINSVTLLPTFSDLNDIKKNLATHTIIGIGHCEKTCLLNISNALKDFYKTSLIKTDFGLFCVNGNASCCVVDLVEGIDKLSISKLSTLYDSNELFYFSLYNVNYKDVLSRLVELESFREFDFSYYQNAGVGYLTFAPTSNTGIQIKEQFKREVIKSFGDLIYCDELKSLEECVDELVQIRRTFCSVVNLSDEMYLDDYFDSLPNFRQFNLSISPQEKLQLNNLDTARDIIQKYDLAFIVLVTGNLEKANICIIDSNNFIKFDFYGIGDTEFKLNSLFNLLLHKIFMKIRKNALFFPENSV